MISSENPEIATTWLKTNPNTLKASVTLIRAHSPWAHIRVVPENLLPPKAANCFQSRPWSAIFGRSADSYTQPLAAADEALHGVQFV